MITHTLALAAAVAASIYALGLQRYIVGIVGLAASIAIYMASKDIKTDS